MTHTVTRWFQTAKKSYSQFPRKAPAAPGGWLRQVCPSARPLYAACFLAALLCGCAKPAASLPVRWQYMQFEIRDLQMDGLKEYTYLEFHNASGWYGSNTVYGAGQLLDQIGAYGWDLAWTDGKTYLVKRPAGVWTNGDFMVSVAIENNR